MNVRHAVALHKATIRLERMSSRAQAAFAGMFSGREDKGTSLKPVEQAKRDAGLDEGDLRLGLLECEGAGFLSVMWTPDGSIEATIQTKKEPA